MTKNEKVQKLVEAFLDKEYGVTLHHWEIAHIVQENERSNEYRSIVNKASKKLLDCGKMIENIRGVGYRVVAPDEYSNQSARCVVSGARRINKGAKIIRNAPVKDMTQDGVQAYNTIADKMRILQAAVAGAKVEINMLSNKRKNPLTVMLEDSKKVG